MSDFGLAAPSPGREPSYIAAKHSLKASSHSYRQSQRYDMARAPQGVHGGGVKISGVMCTIFVIVSVTCANLSIR